MRMEEYAQKATITKVRENVDILLNNLEYPKDFRRDRLMVEITESIVLSYV